MIPGSLNTKLLYKQQIEFLFDDSAFTITREGHFPLTPQQKLTQVLFYFLLEPDTVNTNVLFMFVLLIFGKQDQFEFRTTAICGSATSTREELQSKLCYDKIITHVPVTIGNEYLKYLIFVRKLISTVNDEFKSGQIIQKIRKLLKEEYSDISSLSEDLLNGKAKDFVDSLRTALHEAKCVHVPFIHLGPDLNKHIPNSAENPHIEFKGRLESILKLFTNSDSLKVYMQAKI